jgi:hypothetical protein
MTEKNTANGWHVLVKAFEKIVEQLERKDRKDFQLNLVMDGFLIRPYIRGRRLGSGEIQVEMVSDDFKDPNLTDIQRAWLVAMRWSPPSADCAVFSKRYQPNNSRTLVALRIVATLRVVFNLRRDAWFYFGESVADQTVSSSTDFWHHFGNPAFVCLPEENRKNTVEGLVLA